MNKIWKLLGVAYLLFNFGIQPVAAKEMGGYTIEGVPNINQLDPNLGYFYLHEEVGSTDTVKVKLINTSSKEKILRVKVTNAVTNSNGLIDYTGILAEHSSLKYPLTELAEVTQKEVVVPQESEVETEIKLTMPKERLSGVIIGGIVVSEKSTENQTENQTNGQISLENAYSYTLGLVVTNELKVELNKHLSIELEKVQAKLDAGRKIIEASFLNPNPYIFSDAKVQGTIVNKKNNRVIKQLTTESVNIAPYSVYPFQLDWKKEDLMPGTYLFKGIVTAVDKKWTLEKEFSISNEQAKTINQESVYKISIPSWLRYMTLGTVSGSFFGTFYLILRKRMKVRKQK